jgi:M6 family metalloprotease-like protein
MGIRHLTTCLAIAILIPAAGWAAPTGSLSSLHGVPAYPGLVQTQKDKVIQPDGTNFLYRVRGDETYHWLESAQGYPIQQNPKTGFYEYARLDANGRFQLTGLVVGKNDPAAAGLTKHAVEDPKVIQERRAIAEARRQVAWRLMHPGAAANDNLIPIQRELFPTTGSIRMLVVLCAGNGATTVVSQAGMSKVWNGDPASTTPVSNVAGYYFENSYGQLAIQADVTPWVTLPRPMAFYGDERGTTPTTPLMVMEAIALLNQMGWDFSPYDLNGDTVLEPVVFMHQGEGEEVTGYPPDIWSHQTSFPSPLDVDWATTAPGTVGFMVYEYMVDPETVYGTTITIGVLCHELGHGLGIIDLYDYTYTTEGVGDWCLMGGGSYNGIYQIGDSPSHLCAWAKNFFGWLDPIEVSQPMIGAPLIAQEAEPFAYRINMGPRPWASSEYLLLENRAALGYDVALPGHGMMAYHVDDRAIDNDSYDRFGRPKRQRVVVLQADGFNDLFYMVNRGDDSDPFPGSFGVTALRPYSLYDGYTGRPDTNSYDWGDTNIWIENISAPDPLMAIDIRFFPNMWFYGSSAAALDPVYGTVAFRNGSVRPYYWPGSLFYYDLTILNVDDNFPNTIYCENANPTWLAFWATRNAGLTFDFPLAAPIRFDPGMPGDSYAVLTGADPMASVPTGSYNVCVSIDRPNETRESSEWDNRWMAPRSTLLMLSDSNLNPSVFTDLALYSFSFGPNWARPGDGLQLAGGIVNQGTVDSGPFWIEFWGSYDAAWKDAPTLDFMICDSIPVMNLAPGQWINLASYLRELYPIAPHYDLQTFSIGCYVDRPDSVRERSEANNFQFIGPYYLSNAGPAAAPRPGEYFDRDQVMAGLKPPLQADLRGAYIAEPELAVTYAAVAPSGLAAPNDFYVAVTVCNFGATYANASWTNVFLSVDATLSVDDYPWAAWLYTPGLGPGEWYTVTAYVTAPAIPLGAYQMLVQCDALNNVAEAYEWNDVYWGGPVINGPDLAVDSTAFYEMEPSYVPERGIRFTEPNAKVLVYTRVVNRGLLPAGGFWLEYFGSRTGGLYLDDYLFAPDSILSGVAALSYVDQWSIKAAQSISDGAYTFTAVVDRLRQVPEVYDTNNRGVAGDPIFQIRPLRPCNLKIPVFKFAPNPIRPGDIIKFNGSIGNDGAEHSGPFFVEFWACPNQDIVTPLFSVCDPIYVDNMRPGQQLFLQPYVRAMYANLPLGTYTIVCVVDRSDRIAEPDETDNFKFVRNVTITNYIP